MASSSTATSRNSDLARRPSSKSSSTSEPYLHNSDRDRDQPDRQLKPMTVDGLLRSAYGGSPAAAESTLLDAEITLVDAGVPPPLTRQESFSSSAHKSVDDVWKEIVAGGSQRKECKVESPDEMMTLEDFLAKAGAVEEDEFKVPPAETMSGSIYAFDPIPPTPYQSQQLEESGIGFGNGVEGIGGRGKRRAVMEPLDKAAQQRQRRMIKNRESAARSRERKQVNCSSAFRTYYSYGSFLFMLSISFLLSSMSGCTVCYPCHLMRISFRHIKMNWN